MDLCPHCLLSKGLILVEKIESNIRDEIIYLYQCKDCKKFVQVIKGAA